MLFLDRWNPAFQPCQLGVCALIMVGTIFFVCFLLDPTLIDIQHLKYVLLIVVEHQRAQYKVQSPQDWLWLLLLGHLSRSKSKG